MPSLSNKQCLLCSSPVSVFVTYIESGKTLQAGLCAMHAAKEGILHPHAYDLLAGVSELKAVSLIAMRCPGCGMTRRDFEGRGRMGCAACYETFQPILHPLLTKFQSGARHRGKAPRKAVVARLLDKRLQQLNIRLNEAIADERFEEAALVRDEMYRVRKRAEEHSHPYLSH